MSEIMLTLPPFGEAFLALVVVGATVQVSRALTQGWDQDVAASPPMQAQSPTVRGTVKRLLTGVHHWWIGGLLAYYAAGAGHMILVYIGVGLMIDDYDDMPGRLRDVFRAFMEAWKR